MSTPEDPAEPSSNYDYPPASGPRSTEPREIQTPDMLHQRIRNFHTLRARIDSEMERNLARNSTLPHYQSPSLLERPSIAGTRRAFAPRTRARSGAPIYGDQDTNLLMERLSDVTSEADSLLEQPIPRIGSPDLSTREYEGEAAVNSRSKRRKMEHVPTVLASGMNGFRYPYRGSIVPGPLKMEIVSCDGGILADVITHGRSRDFHSDNVLRNDKSVYSTNSNKCNIMLRHVGEAIFTLSKLVVKAPPTGFTAPIQEGLIFVSMTSRDLLSQTSRYHVRSPSPRERDENSRPLSRRRDSASRTVPPPISMSARRSTYHDILPPSLADFVPSPPGFEVTTHCDSPSSDDEEPSSATTLADLQRRGLGPPLYDGSSVTDTDEERSVAVFRRMPPDSLAGERRTRRRRRTQPSRITVRGSIKNPDSLPLNEGGTDEKGTLSPHARFFIEKERNVVSIRFNPPVAGKFILLKLWSPGRSQNIDIQSIIAHGFAGPRFFPSTDIS